MLLSSALPQHCQGHQSPMSPSATSTRLLSPCSDRGSSTALVSLCQGWTTLLVKKLSLISNLTLLWHSLRSFPLALVLVTWEKCLTPAGYHLPRGSESRGVPCTFLLRVPSIPSSGSWLKTPNRSDPSTGPWGQPLLPTTTWAPFPLLPGPTVQPVFNPVKTLPIQAMNSQFPWRRLWEMIRGFTEVQVDPSTVLPSFP